MLLGLVMVVTLVAYQQDTVTHKDSLPPPASAPVPVPATAPLQPTIEQIRFMEGLKTATRGIAQIKNGVQRVVRTQQAGDSLTRRRAARRLGGLCGTARTFIVSGRPKMLITAYADTMRALAKQLTTRLDSLNAALPVCEKSAGGDPSTVATTLTSRLKNYDDALLAFRIALKPDSTKTVSQQ